MIKRILIILLLFTLFLILKTLIKRTFHKTDNSVIGTKKQEKKLNISDEKIVEVSFKEIKKNEKKESSLNGDHK